MNRFHKSTVNNVKIFILNFYIIYLQYFFLQNLIFMCTFSRICNIIDILRKHIAYKILFFSRSDITMQKKNSNPTEKKYPENKDTKRTCTSPCRECERAHYCPNVCPVFKKAIEA